MNKHIFLISITLFSLTVFGDMVMTSGYDNKGNYFSATTTRIGNMEMTYGF